MPIAQPASNNPVSGVQTGNGGTVIFDTPFSTVPHVVITPMSNRNVWVTDVTEESFTWTLSGPAIVTIMWISDRT